MLQNVCRICLASHVKMYHCNQHKLKNFYEELTKFNVNEYDNYPRWFCFECAALLKKSWVFLKKCQKALNILETFTAGSLEISENDRSQFALNSCLKIENVHNFIEICELKEEPCEEQNKTEFCDVILAKDDDIVTIESPKVENRSWDSEDDIPIKNKRTKLSTKKHSKPKTVKKTKAKLVKLEQYTEVNPITIQRRKLAEFIKEKTTIKMFTQEEVWEQMNLKKELKSYQKLSFKCELCFKGFSKSQLYDRHFSITHDPKIGDFECDACHHRFRKKIQVRKHWDAAHSRKYFCKQCGHQCNNSSQALEHQRQRHMNEKYKCRHCGEEYGSRSSYYQHLRTSHSSEFVCELCGCEFESAPGLHIHKKMKHPLEDESFQDELALHCEECNLTFVGQHAYNTHRMKKHHSIGCRGCGELFSCELSKKEHRCPRKRINRRRGLTCHICGIEFANYGSLHFHRKAAHSQRTGTRKEKKKHPCAECGALFVSAMDHARHLKYHTGEVLYQCDYCVMAFATKRQLDSHMVSHAGAMPYLCSHCGKSYTKEIELQRHLRNVQSRLQCNICGEKFENEELARKHRSEAHADVRPYTCNLCGKGFNSSGHLYLHMTSHAGIKQYGCDKCGKKYRSNVTLRLHIMTVHMKMPDPYHRNDTLKRQRAKV